MELSTVPSSSLSLQVIFQPMVMKVKRNLESGIVYATVDWLSSTIFLYSPLAPGDYDNATVDVTFNSGDTELPAPIAIVNDLIVEDMEIFRLSLSSTDARAVTGPGSQVIILDDGDCELKTYYKWFIRSVSVLNVGL